MEGYHYQVVILLLCSFINGFSYTVNHTQQLFPYASSLVMSFGLVDSRNETGYFVGIIASATMLGRALSAPIWGHIADVYGRKLVLVVSMSTTVVVSLLFSVVPNYPLAVLLRTCLGSFSAMAVVGKTAVAECVPRDLASTGMMVYTSGFFIGESIGTGVGGLLYGLWLQDFPWALPNLLCAAVSLIVLVLLLLFFHETLPKADRSTESFSFRPFFSILNSRQVGRLVSALAISCFISTAFHELVPLLCWAEKSHGGLDMSPQTIGGMLTASTTVSITLQQFAYPRLVKRYGSSAVTVKAASCMTLLILVLPFSAVAGSWYWLLFLTGLVGIYMLMFQVNTGVFVLMNDAVPVDKRGKLNGVGMLFCCIFRSMSAVSTGSTFAWSLGVNSFPIDYHLVFLLLGLLAVVERVVVGQVSDAEGDFELVRIKDTSEDSSLKA
jgi:MFS family permease